MIPRRPVISYIFSSLNVPPERIPTDSDSFTLTAHPQTDLWRKPPGQDTSTAPVLFTNLRFPFVSAEVTVDAKWALEWDQAGLVIFAGAPPGVTPISPTANTDLPPPYSAGPATGTKWVKVGLEFSNDACHASCTVASAEGADWAISSLPPAIERRGDLRIKLERLAQALWVYYEDERGAWRKFREVTGFFCGVQDKAVRVGVYASRPAGFGGGGQGGSFEGVDRNLTVEFQDLLIF